MKAAVLLTILAYASGVPQMTSSPTAVGGSSGVLLGEISAQGGSGSQFGSGGSFPQQHNWGPTAYGPGLNNRFAFPPNPFVMQRAIALTKRVPNTLVRVGVDGQVQITDRHGFEVDIDDWFGIDITEGIEVFEEGPFGFHGGYGNGFDVTEDIEAFEESPFGYPGGYGNGFDITEGIEDFEEGPFGFPSGFGNGFGNDFGHGFANSGHGGVGIGLNGF